MTRHFCIFLTLAALLYLTGCDRRITSIEYQGEKFKTSKIYLTYDDYKQDSTNLAPQEIPRIEAAILKAEPGTNFVTREQLVQAVTALKFPGYGLTQFGEKSQPDGSLLDMFAVEIPQQNKNRYFVMRQTGSKFILVDDFEAATTGRTISSVKLEGSSLRYYDANNLLIRLHPVKP
ncbi:MAG TPA: hypothetical protein VG347_04575 [Verrucomicrobiae bacterium]|nr:hypothetical protein [Verrucomicrobiae bacterium]